MSKFVDNIKAELTFNNKDVMEPLKFNCDVTPNAILPIYDIYVKFGRTVACKPEDLNRMIDNVVKELNNEIYEEFILKILDLQRAVYAYDFNKAEKIINEIYNEVLG